MKIIFDNKEQKKQFIKNIATNSSFCPEDLGIKVDVCYRDDCTPCWESVIKMEVKMTDIDEALFYAQDGYDIGYREGYNTCEDEMEEIIESMAYEIFMNRNPKAYFCPEEEQLNIMKEFGWK